MKKTKIGQAQRGASLGDLYTFLHDDVHAEREGEHSKQKHKITWTKPVYHVLKR